MMPISWTPDSALNRRVARAACVAALIVIAGVVLASGGYINQLKDHGRRLDQLETDARTDAKTRTEMLQQLDLRLARIEVKLEMMAPPKPEKAP